MGMVAEIEKFSVLYRREKGQAFFRFWCLLVPVKKWHTGSTLHMKPQATRSQLLKGRAQAEKPSGAQEGLGVGVEPLAPPSPIKVRVRKLSNEG
mmetsp:Transcript_4222/g.6665  ORF Transcript_4222/g.6665 Transcript_4222/m.6665 type:complete len:94 (+) Transcript_4222:182-463(+)